MAYDSPKAAHFDAIIAGTLIPWNNEMGLRIRWKFAHLCESVGINDMLHVDSRKLNKLLKEFNQDRENSGVSLRIRK